MFVGEDLDSYYEQCLQCSYRHELRDIAEFKKQLIQKEEELVPVGGNRRKEWPVLTGHSQSDKSYIQRPCLEM